MAANDWPVFEISRAVPAPRSAPSEPTPGKPKGDGKPWGLARRLAHPLRKSAEENEDGSLGWHKHAALLRCSRATIEYGSSPFGE